jgi:hypothetical protein
MSMRTVGLVLFATAVAACAPKDEAATDSTAAAAAATPTALTPAALAGTWSGTTMAETSDSVMSRWTVVARPEGGGMFIGEGAKDSVAFTATFDGDSSVVTSAPYSDPAAPAGSPQVMFRGIARMTGANSMGGTTSIMLANKPDSVVARTRWTATRQ